MKKILTLMACGLIGPTSMAQVESGLIAKYPFNGNANDLVGGHDGSVQGATLTTDRFGMSDAAYHFSSDNSQFIEVPYSPDFTPGSTPMTVSVWFQATASDTSGGMLIDWYRCGAVPNCNSNDGALYNISIIDTSKVFYWVRDDVNTDTSYVTSTSFNNGDWHHAVLVFDPDLDYFKTYINNNELDSVPVNLTSISDGGHPVRLSIGRRYISGWGNPIGYFSGKIDDIRIYGRALSAIEIDSLYHEGGFVGIADQEADVAISVFPNPTTDIVQFDNQNGSKLQLSLFNTLGKEVMTTTLNIGNNSVDLSALSNNIYLYRIASKGIVLKTGSLIKM